MPKEFDNTNRGALFKNDRRQKPTHPEYAGSLNVDGTEYWINAWVKEGKRGQFFSLSVKLKDTDRVASSTKRQEQGSAPRAQTRRDDFDDDIPF